MSTPNTSRTLTERFARHAVLILPLVLVNSAAIYGQIQWARDHLTDGSYPLAALFALTVESIAIYLAYEAHAALLAGDASFRLRIASYLAAGLVGTLNYSHFATDDFRPTTAAVVFGALSAISPWLWSIRSRSLRRDQLRTAGLIDPRSAHFALAKWMHFPVRTLKTFRYSVDHGIQNERSAWESARAVRNGDSPETVIDDEITDYKTHADALRHAFSVVGRDVPKARAWLRERGLDVNRSYAYQVLHRMDDEPERPALVAVASNGNGEVR